MTARRVRYGLNPVLWAQDQFGISLDPWQQRALTSGSKRMLFLASRQSGKSTVCQLKALHDAIFKPGSLTVILAPCLRQSSEAFRQVSKMLRQLDEMPELIEDNTLGLTMANGSRIAALPATENTIRGFAHVTTLVLDEASRIDDSLFGAVMPFVAISGGAVIAASTPAGRRGFFHALWEGDEPWQRESIRGDEVPRLSAEFLAEQRRLFGERFYRQEFLCSFEDTEDQLFRSDDIAAMFDPTVRPLFEVVA
jgi:hypothetical protein